MTLASSKLAALVQLAKLAALVQLAKLAALAALVQLSKLAALVQLAKLEALVQLAKLAALVQLSHCNPLLYTYKGTPYSATISCPHLVIGAAQGSEHEALPANFQLTKPHIMVDKHIAMVASEQTKLGGG
eukprot:gene22362-29461_t